MELSAIDIITFVGFTGGYAMITAFYAGGHLYATPERLEPII